MAYEKKLLEWDPTGERNFESGVSHCVLYSPVKNATGDIETFTPVASGPKEPIFAGVAWNGFTGLTEKPGGAEATKLWANNGLYATMRSAESLGVTIEAYTYPNEWKRHNGQFSPKEVEGKFGHFAVVGQQAREAFRLSYITQVGNDLAPSLPNQKLHMIWNATASPSERAYKTINDSPEAITFSWEAECSDTTVSQKALAPNGKLCDMSLDLTALQKANEDTYQKLIDMLHGKSDASSGNVAFLPSPDVVYDLLQGTQITPPTITTVSAEQVAKQFNADQNRKKN